MHYYTYLIIDPITRQPFYVGKGTGTRMYWHWRQRNAKSVAINHLVKKKFNKLEQQGLAPLYEKVLVNATEEAALQKEQELIKQYGRIDLGTGILFNFTDGGDAGATSWSPATRERKRQRELAKQKGRPVSQYTLEGKHVNDFTSAKKASESVPGANRSYITQVCKGRRKSAGGFLWTYKGDSIPKFNKEYYSPVIQVDIKTKKQINIFRSMTEAQKLTGVELHCISEACRGKSKTAGGYMWLYA